MIVNLIIAFAAGYAVLALILSIDDVVMQIRDGWDHVDSE